jgi:5-hydroxyisourate hydrolase-like protein (transthyretin family)
MRKELSFYEFTQLSEEGQYELVFKEGEFLNSSTKNDLKFALYKLYSFFVEVVYDAQRNKVVSLTSFMYASK